MTPRLSEQERRHGGLADAVAVGDGLLGSACRTRNADRAHDLLGQFRVRVSFPSRHRRPRMVVVSTKPLRMYRSPMSSLGDHVAQIVGLRSQEQMVRPHALAIVATVADEQVGGDRTTEIDPREPVRGITDPVTSHAAIAFRVQRTSPPPARLRLQDAVPEECLPVWLRAELRRFRMRATPRHLVARRAEVTAEGWAIRVSRAGLHGGQFTSLKKVL